MLLDYKIAYILSKEVDIFTELNSRLHAKLKISGNAELKYIVVIKAIIQLFNTDILTYNLALELYKKLIHLLRYNKIMINPNDVALGGLTTEADNPIYWGAGNSGLSVAQLQSLTTSNLEFVDQLSFNYTLTEQVYYFCYPASVGTLSSILDNNQFETLPGWTLRTESFVFSGLPNVTYNVYEFNNITTQTSFTNTFIL